MKEEPALLQKKKPSAKKNMMSLGLNMLYESKAS
jgi:hypothetical protein